MEIEVNGIRMRSSTRHPNYYFSEDGQYAYSLRRKTGRFLTFELVKGYKKINKYKSTFSCAQEKG